MIFQSLKRLVIEDFPQDQQALVSKIAFIYNPVVDQLNTMFNKNIDFNNLNQQIVSIDVIVDKTGAPISALQVATTLKTAIQGASVIFAYNNTDNTPVTGAPFLTFTRNVSSITITNITGLSANKKFTLTVILYG